MPPLAGMCPIRVVRGHLPAIFPGGDGCFCPSKSPEFVSRSSAGNPLLCRMHIPSSKRGPSICDGSRVERPFMLGGFQRVARNRKTLTASRNLRCDDREWVGRVARALASRVAPGVEEGATPSDWSASKLGSVLRYPL